MATIKTENFSFVLQLFRDSIDIEVRSYNYSCMTGFDAVDFEIDSFVFLLEKMYKDLKGSARIKDLITDSYIEFVAEKSGYITVKGKLTYWKHEATQMLFEHSVDQTYLRDFVKTLATDWEKLTK